MFGGAAGSGTGTGFHRMQPGIPISIIKTAIRFHRCIELSLSPSQDADCVMG